MKLSANALFCVLGAATAGVIIGMLIAPEKGEDLRKNIRRTAADLADRLSDVVANEVAQISEPEPADLEAFGDPSRNGKS
jgi:gas vesicle protein